MKISFLKIAFTISLIFNLSVIAAAGYVYHTRNNTWLSPMGVRIQKDKFLFEEMGLQPDQIQGMRKKAIPFRAEIDRRRQEIATKRQHLISLMRDNHPDTNAIDAAVSDISSMQGQLEAMVTAHILQVKASLTKEQQKKFLDLIENAQSKGKQTGCPPMMPNQQ